MSASPKALGLVTALGLTAAVVVLCLHVDSSRLLTHTVGVFALLAELLRSGVLYPPEPTSDLVYGVFYHPLAFAPIALLPGEGLALIRSMRVLVGVETLTALALAAYLARSGAFSLRLQSALWALCTVPVGFALIGMRDDPRALLFGLLALAAFGHSRRWGPALAGVLLALAFFTKVTAPIAPGAALLWAALRQGQGGGRAALRLLAVSTIATLAGIAVLQWGLGCDFLGNGLHYMVVAPPRAARPLGELAAAFCRDLGYDAWTPVLLGLATAGAGWRLARARAGQLDVLLLASIVKTLVVYRSWGTDLNHMLDMVVFAAMAFAQQLGAWLTATRALCVFAIALGLGAPWQWLIPAPGTPTVAASPLAAAATALRAQPPAPTLCEEPLLAWLAGTKPIVVDPFLTFATLAPAPEIRRRWFGPTSDPAALRRLVLMHDPRRTDSAIHDWYEHIHFDPEFLASARRDWTVLLTTDNATVLVR